MQPALIYRGQLGKGSLSSSESLIRGPNSLSHFKAGHLGTLFDNRSRQIAAQDVWIRRRTRNQAAANVGINRIEVHCRDPNQALRWPRFRRGKITVDNYFG